MPLDHGEGMAPRIELDHRTDSGLDVTLLWDPQSGDVALQVIDWVDDDDFYVELHPACALDAFQHPFAYAPGTAWQDIAAPDAEPLPRLQS